MGRKNRRDPNTGPRGDNAPQTVSGPLGVGGNRRPGIEERVFRRELPPLARTALINSSLPAAFPVKHGAFDRAQCRISGRKPQAAFRIRSASATAHIACLLFALNHFRIAGRAPGWEVAGKGARRAHRRLWRYARSTLRAGRKKVSPSCTALRRRPDSLLMLPIPRCRTTSHISQVGGAIAALPLTGRMRDTRIGSDPPRKTTKHRLFCSAAAHGRGRPAHWAIFQRKATYETKSVAKRSPNVSSLSRRN